MVCDSARSGPMCCMFLAGAQHAAPLHFNICGLNLHQATIARCCQVHSFASANPLHVYIMYRSYATAAKCVRTGVRSAECAGLVVMTVRVRFPHSQIYTLQISMLGAKTLPRYTSCPYRSRSYVVRDHLTARTHSRQEPARICHVNTPTCASIRCYARCGGPERVRWWKQ